MKNKLDGVSHNMRFRITLIIVSMSLVSLLVPLESVYGAAVSFVLPSNPNDGIMMDAADRCTNSFPCDAQMVVIGSDVYLLWQERDSAEIRFRSSSDGGVNFASETTLGTGAVLPFLGTPSLAAFGNNVYAAWNAGGSIKFNERSNFGSAAIQLSGVTNTAITPQVATPGSDDVYVVWYDTTDNSILFKASTNKGLDFNTVAEKDIGNTSTLPNPQIASKDDSVHVVWSKDVDILLSTSTNKGGVFGRIGEAIDNADTSTTDPQVAMSGSDLHVVWQQGGIIKYAKSSNDGEDFAITDVGFGGTTAAPQMAIAGSNVYLTWQNVQKIQFAASNDNFNVQDIGNTGTSSAVFPEIAADGTNVAIVWRDFTNDAGGDVFAKVSSDSGLTFEASATAMGDEFNDQFSRDPVAGITGNKVLVAFQESSPASSPSDTLFFKIGTIGGPLVEFDQTQYKIGGTATIKVTSTDPLHIGAGIILVDVTSTSDTAGISVTLDETALNSGIFEGTVTLVAGSSNQANRELHAETGFNGDVITATFGNGATATIFPIELKLVSAGAEILPLFGFDYSSIANFEVSDPSANSDPLVAETITIDITSTFETISLPLKETGPDTGIFSEDITKNDHSLAEITFMTGNNLIPVSGDEEITYDFSTGCIASICNPALIDTIKVDVTSTSDPVGFSLDFVETDIDTKIFQGTFSTTVDASSGTSIQVKLGDFVELDTQIPGVISDNFFVTTGATTNVVGSRGGIQVAIPLGDFNMSVSYNPQVDFSVRDIVAAGGGGGGLVRAGLVVNALGFLKTSSALGFGGGGSGPAPPTITSSTISLEPDPSFTQLGLGSYFGVPSVIDLGDSSGPISIQTSQSITFTFDIYENQGINNLEHVTMYFFAGDTTDLSNSEIISNSDTYILFDTGQSVHVIDPYGYFENAEFSISEIDTWNFEIKYDITFAKPMETSSILIRSWDRDRNTADKIFVDALEVVEPSFGDVPNEITSQVSLIQTDLVDIPLWVKNNAYWWNQFQISDSDFISGIEFLINQNVIYVPNTETTNSATSDDVPDWVRDVAGFWASDSISDAEFISAVQWMISNGIMVIA